MRWLVVILFLLLAIARGDAATQVTCTLWGLTQPCETALSVVEGDTVVNLKAPFFGCRGDLSADDTACIQKAIDFAYANGFQTVFCPSGQYAISGSGNAKIYLDPPGNLRTSWSNPPLFQFSLWLKGEGSYGISNATRAQGCQFIATDGNSNVGIIVGPGQHMGTKNISVIGAGGAYRANQPSTGVGIGIAAGGGGAHHTTIENTSAENWYALFKANANGGCCLADSNNFIHVSGGNAAIGIWINGTQAYINRVEEPTLSATIGISDVFSKTTVITGGNISATDGIAASFGISSISGLTVAGDGSFTFTGVIASPDSAWPNVYNSFTIATATFGIIPLTLNAWNGGNPATFEITPAWVTGNFGRSAIASTDLPNEIAAVSTIYAAERVTVLKGAGISTDGLHIENPTACTTWYDLTATFGGMTAATVKNTFFNYDPAITVYRPSNSPTSAQLARFYCQQAFGFIRQNNDQGLFARLTIDGGSFGGCSYQFACASAPLLFELQPGQTLSARGLDSLAPINLRIWDTAWYSFTEIGGFNQIDTLPNGAGDWDNNYFLPHGINDVSSFPGSCLVACAIEVGKLRVPYHGYRPAPGQMPVLTDLYSTVSGTLGALGSYPPIDCQTEYQSKVTWNTGTVSATRARSAHCPGYSWGQDLSDATVGSSHGTFTGVQSNGSGGAGTQLVVTGLSGSLGVNDEITGSGFPAGHTYITACPGGGCNTNGTYTVSQSANIASETMKSFATTVTWSYKGFSVFLYLDSATLKWFFPGMCFTIPGAPANPSDNYVVTGVYPQLGYISAINVSRAQAGNPNAVGGLLQANDINFHSCTVKCVIGQAAYSWTQY